MEKGKGKAKAKKKAVNEKVQVQAVKEPLTFEAKVKAKRNNEKTILIIDGKQKEYQTSQKATFQFSDLGLGKGLDKVFPSLYGSFGYETSVIQFCVKAGYHKTQIGYNRKGFSSWKGLLGLTDGQFCVWEWSQKGLTFETICELGNTHGLTRNKQGKNWVTFHFGKGKEDALIAFSNAVIGTLKGK